MRPTPRSPWAKYLEKAQIRKRFTIHGLRYTFTALVQLANVDAVVRRALTGHVTEEMQRHYSTVGLDEKRAAVAGVLRLVPAGIGRERREPNVLDRGFEHPEHRLAHSKWGSRWGFGRRETVGQLRCLLNWPPSQRFY